MPVTTFTRAGTWGPDGIIDTVGRPQPNATVGLYLQDGVTLATRYADVTKAATAPNPWAADPLGNVSLFYADPGSYVLKITVGGRSTSLAIEVPVDPTEAALDEDIVAADALVATEVARAEAAELVLAADVATKADDAVVVHLTTPAAAPYESVTRPKNFNLVRTAGRPIDVTHPDYGARLDGVHDDGAATQLAALVAAQEAADWGYTMGRKIYIPQSDAGALFQTGVVVPSLVTIEGDDALILNEAFIPGAVNYTGNWAFLVADAFRTRLSSMRFVSVSAGAWWQVSGAANNGAGRIRITTRTPHTLVTGNTVSVRSVKGTIEANKTWVVTVIDSTHIDLNGSTFTHTYISGGIVNFNLNPQVAITWAGVVVDSIISDIDVIDPQNFGVQYSDARTDPNLARWEDLVLRNVKVRGACGGTGGGSGLILFCRSQYDADTPASRNLTLESPRLDVSQTTESVATMGPQCAKLQNFRGGSARDVECIGGSIAGFLVDGGVQDFGVTDLRCYRNNRGMELTSGTHIYTTPSRHLTFEGYTYKIDGLVDGDQYTASIGRVPDVTIKGIDGEGDIWFINDSTATSGSKTERARLTGKIKGNFGVLDPGVPTTPILNPVFDLELVGGPGTGKGRAFLDKPNWPVVRPRGTITCYQPEQNALTSYADYPDLTVVTVDGNPTNNASIAAIDDHGSRGTWRSRLTERQTVGTADFTAPTTLRFPADFAQPNDTGRTFTIAGAGGWLVSTNGATAGAVTLTYGAYTTTPLAWNAGTGVIRAALEALPSIGVGHVTVVGGLLAGATISLTAPASTGQNQLTAAITTALTGGALTVSPVDLATTVTYVDSQTVTLAASVGASVLGGKVTVQHNVSFGYRNPTGGKATIAELVGVPRAGRGIELLNQSKLLIGNWPVACDEFVLSGGPQRFVIPTPHDTIILGVAFIYTEASSADAGIVINIGDLVTPNLYAVYTSQPSKAVNAFDLLANTVGLNSFATRQSLSGHCIVVSTAGGKVGAGRIMPTLSLLREED